MKKFLTALFVFVCAFAFIGCRRQKTEDPQKTPELPKINLEETSIEITVGDEYLLPATATLDAKLILKAADETILSIDGFTLKGLKEGQTTVTVTVEGHEDINATVTVKVVAGEPTPTPGPTHTPTPQVIKITGIAVAGNASMEVGATQTLTITVSPSDAADKSYDLVSSDPSVATVDANGLVTALAKGSVTITATAKDGSGVKGTLAITVKEQKPAEPTDIHIIIGDKEYANGDTINLTEFDEVQITWKYFPEDKPVQEGVDASVSNEKYATIDADGKLKALEPGNVALVVYALYGDVELTFVVAIAEKHFDPESLEISGVAELAVREELQLTATITPERADQSVVWSSSDETIATVSENGLVKALAQGTVTIKAQSTALETVYKEVTLTINPEAQYDRSIFYVDPSYTEKGAKITVDGKEYEVGQNLQASIAAAVKAADAGAKIYVAAGKYEDDIDLDQSVYIIGAEGAEVELAGKIVPQSGLDGFGFANIHFTTSAGIVGPADATSYKNFSMMNCNFDKATAGDDASIRFYGECEDFSFIDNKFYMTTYRGIRFETKIVNLSVLNNEFTTTGTMYDYVRAMGQAGGEIIFVGNSFDFSNQSGVQIASPIEGAQFSFYNNYFKDMTNTSIDIREPAGEFVNGIEFDIQHNKFEGGANDWGVIRMRTVNLTEEQVLAKVNYNIFLEIDPADAGGADAPYFVDMAGQSTLQQFGNFDKNFAILGETVLKPDPEKAGQVTNYFQGQDASAIDWFDTLEALEAAWEKLNNPGDLFVDPEAEEDETHFKTIAAALAAAEADMVIVVEAGEYTDALTFDKNVSLIGPNQIPGYAEAREAEAVLAGAITVNEGTVVSIDGFKLAARIDGTSPAGFTLTNTLVAGGYYDILFNGHSKNVVLKNLLVEPSTIARFFRSNGDVSSASLENLTVEDCIFNNKGEFDWLRSDGIIYGDVLISGNTFNGSEQSAIMFMYHGSGNFQIVNNDFLGMKCVAVDIRTSNGVACESTFNISYNLFDNTGRTLADEWNPIRLRFNNYTPETLTATVNYNAFLNWGDATGYCFCENASGQKDISKCVNYDYNFFDMITEPTDANFDSMASSWANAFATYKAWAIATGREEGLELSIVTKLPEDFYIGDALELEVSASEGLEYAWSTSNEAVAKVEDGKLIGVAAGTATITLSAEGALPVELEVTVKELPTTFDEVTVDATLEEEHLNEVKTVARALELIAEGGTITVKAGEYADALTISKEVTIVGPNADKAGVAEDRAEEALLSGAITLADGVGATFVGVKFNAKVSGNNVNGLVLKNSVAGSAAMFEFSGLVKDAYIEGLFANDIAANRFFRTYGQFENLTILDSKFVSTAGIWDWFLSAKETYGNVLIENNIFDGSNQSAIKFDAHGSGTFKILHNEFYKVQSTFIDIRTTASACTSDFDISYNLFDGKDALGNQGQWGAVRPRLNNYTAETLTFKFNYNAFLGWTASILQNGGNAASVFNFANCDYNYIEGLAEQTADTYSQLAASFANGFTDFDAWKAAMEAAYLVKDFRETVYVDPALEKETDTKFKTFEAAYEKVLEGGTIILAKGTHAENMTIAKSLTLKGEEGAVVTGIIAVNHVAKNVTIEELEFTGAARVISFAKNYEDLVGFKFQGNYVHDTNAAAKAWQQTSYGTGIATADASAYPGFLCLNGNYAWVKNPQILNNTFENLGDTAVFVNCTADATVTGNTFMNVVNDGVRFEYASNYGVFEVKDNAFVDCSFFGVYLRSYAASAGPMDFTLESNYFKHCGFDANASVCTRSKPGAFGTAAHQEATDAVFKVNYNYFEDCAGYINIRGNVTTSATYGHVFTLDAGYNAFITSAEAMICGNFFGSDSASSNFAIGTFNNNFYGTDANTKYAPAASQFEHILAMDTATFDTLALLEAGLPEGAHLGKDPVKTGPLSVAEMIAKANELIPNRNDVTTEALKLVGIVSAAPQDKGTLYNNLYLKDALSDTAQFLVYDLDKTEEIFENDKITVKGFLKNYNGTKEMTTVGEDKVQLLKVERGLSPITLANDSSADVTVTGLPESALNLSDVSFSFTLAEGAILDAVLLNGEELVPANGSYSFTVKGKMVLKFETHKEGEAVPTLYKELLIVPFQEGDTSNAGYTDSTTYVRDGITLTAFAFNNNKLAATWTDGIRCGRSKDASQPTLATSQIADAAIAKFVITFTALCDLGKINSAKVVAYSDAEMTQVVEEVDIKASLIVGDVTAKFANPQKGLYYRLELDLAATGTNGNIRVSGIALWEVELPAPKANLLLDYEEFTSDAAYSGQNTVWTVAKYTTEWAAVTAEMMRVRGKDGSRVVNMAVGYSTPYRYTYNENGESLGLANFFSIDLGNYFSGAAACPMKIALTTVDGKIIYIKGDASNWAELPVTTGLETISGSFEAAEIANLYLVFKSSLGGGGYIYMDNVTLSYKEAAAVPTAAELGEAFVADFNAFTNAGLDSAADLDTDHMSGKLIGEFCADATNYAKWSWLLAAIHEVAGGDAAIAPASADWAATAARSFYLANLNGFFTSTQHKDTWWENTSADWTNAELTAAVLAKYPQA